jgi:hypothetical protein
MEKQVARKNFILKTFKKPNYLILLRLLNLDRKDEPVHMEEIRNTKL